ncbi:hypothetical protein CALCODRAFT_234509 [Calocera cornea HHB12733]|uniref:F-box domain-containing protein n=1 Tax=Calocera cornea HHB12733 TaxID=1353952 RepID=A0A165GXQ9_9BASI|nr:hypothetical protein CALCODRAFT_234509 [Calocera cornea HHB12733]
MAEVAKEDPAFGRKANLVCRRWHIISHAVPSLWSHISICSGSSFHTAELYLERARVGPLTVYLRNLTLHEARIDKYFFNTAVALVKPHRKRITGLTIRTYTVNTLAHALGELVGKRGTSAPLRTLDISLCVPCPAAPLRGLLRYTMPAQLQSIRFDRALLANVGPPCALRSLHISRPEQWANNFQTLREFAATYPALRSLRIDNWDQQLPPVPHTGVRELAFPEVEELRLWKCRADNVHLLLAHLRTPRLNNVDIAFSSVPYQPNADGFQDLHGLALVQLAEIGNLASPHGDDRHARGIQTLTFANLQSSLAELLHVLKACKYLRSLSFTRCNLTNDPVNWLANPTPKGPWLAQYLESLKIDECGAVEGFAFRQFAFNRWTGAENKWCVRLKELEIRGCSRVTQKDVAFCRQRVEVVTFSQ